MQVCMCMHYKLQPTIAIYINNPTTTRVFPIAFRDFETTASFLLVLTKWWSGGWGCKLCTCIYYQQNDDDLEDVAVTEWVVYMLVSCLLIEMMHHYYQQNDDDLEDEVVTESVVRRLVSCLLLDMTASLLSPKWWWSGGWGSVLCRIPWQRAGVSIMLIVGRSVHQQVSGRFRKVKPSWIWKRESITNYIKK